MLGPGRQVRGGWGREGCLQCQMSSQGQGWPGIGSLNPTVWLPPVPHRMH